MPQAVASRYAHALVDAVTAPGAGLDPRQVAGELHAFESMVNGSPELRVILLSPAVSISRKQSVIGRLAAAVPVSKLVRNFLFVLVDRRRSDLLGEIAAAFENALDERLGFVRAQVASAGPLSDRQRADLQAALSEVAGKQVRCEFNSDPSLIGGVVARIGSTVYDGSVRTQLQSLRQRLVS